MMHANSQPITLGYLSAHEDPVAGVVGGFLILNIHGRPMELHCSVPVRINRAQSLLYGESLRPQLFGHTIAPALLEAAAYRPCLIVTDSLDMLALRALVDTPIAYVHTALSEGSAGSRGASHDEDQEIAGCRCMAAPGFRDDIAEIRRRWSELRTAVEMHEPFQRLREALREMTGVGTASGSQAA